MKSIFKDSKLQNQYDELGYVIVPLLNENEILELIGFYKNLEIETQTGFHISLDLENLDTVRACAHKIISVLGPKVMPMLEEGMPFIASFTIKEQGKHAIVPPHQDWTFVDENQYSSATVWVPLQDVTFNNGALGIIEGSHKVFINPRPSPSPQVRSAFCGYEKPLMSLIQVIELKAGDALIFDNALIHASPPNLSDKPRLAIGMGITSKHAQLIHYYVNPGATPATIEKYAVDKDFFIKYNNPKLSELYDIGRKISDYQVLEKIAKEEIAYKEEAILNFLRSKNVNLEVPEKVGKQVEEKQNEPDKVNSQQVEESILEHNIGTVDTRTFLQKYTPANVVAEIKWRLKNFAEKNNAQ